MSVREIFRKLIYKNCKHRYVRKILDDDMGDMHIIVMCKKCHLAHLMRKNKYFGAFPVSELSYLSRKQYKLFRRLKDYE